jgi:hypothetical protein
MFYIGVNKELNRLAAILHVYDFYEVKKNIIISKKSKGKYFYISNHFYSEKSSKRPN